MTAMKSPTGAINEPKQKWDSRAPTVQRFRRQAPGDERLQKHTDKHSQALADHYLPGAVKTAPMRRRAFNPAASAPSLIRLQLIYLK
jgi:hypothetical protein